MPQVFSCNAEWLEVMKEGHKRLVIAAWNGGDEEKIKLFEKLAEVENYGIPVFVVDRESCPGLAEKFSLKETGDVIICIDGREDSRCTVASEEDIKKISDKLLKKEEK